MAPQNQIPRNHFKLKFIDSYKFLNTRLEKLASFLNLDKLKIINYTFQFYVVNKLYVPILCCQ